MSVTTMPWQEDVMHAVPADSHAFATGEVAPIVAHEDFDEDEDDWDDDDEEDDFDDDEDDEDDFDDDDDWDDDEDDD